MCSIPMDYVLRSCQADRMGETLTLQFFSCEKSIMIGDDIEITIADIYGVHRKDIYEAIQRKKTEKDNSTKTI